MPGQSPGVEFPVRAPPSSSPLTLPRCISVCAIRRDPSYLAPILAQMLSTTPFVVQSVSPDGWAQVYAAINPTTSIGGFVRVEQLANVTRPSPLGPLRPGDLSSTPSRADRELPPFQDRPDRPIPPVDDPQTPPPVDDGRGGRERERAPLPETTVQDSRTMSPLVETLILASPLLAGVLLSLAFGGKQP